MIMIAMKIILVITINPVTRVSDMSGGRVETNSFLPPDAGKFMTAVTAMITITMVVILIFGQ